MAATERARGRRWLVAGASLSVIVLVAVALTLVLRHDDRSGSAEFSVPDGLQVSFVPATGVRTGAPTVVTGAVINTGSTSRPASFTIGSLPSGASLTTVLPSSSAPSAGGQWWSCSASTCTLSTSSGPTTLGPDAGVELLLAFGGVPATPDASMVIDVDGVGRSSVALQLPDGAPSLAADALELSITGGSTVITGTPATATAKVTNFATTTVAPGALTVQVTAPAIAGLATVPSGAGWTCSATSCTNTASIAPLAVSAPLSLSLSAPVGTATGSGTLGLVAAVTAPSMQASESLPVTVRPARSSTVGTRVFLDRGSVVEGTVLTATIEVVATGQGQLTDTVDVSLDLPSGLAADWSSASASGPFTCSSTGCSSTGPLDAGTQYLIDVPVDIAVGVRPGTSRITVDASISDGTASTPQPSSSASFTIVPAPAASLRARLTGVTGVDPTGGAIGFASGADRDLQVTVTNRGASPFRAGGAVYVTATPSTNETVTSAGGDGWSCTPSQGEISPRWPLRCHLILSADLAPSGTITLPFSLAPDDGGTTDWTVGVGTSMRTANDAISRARVEVRPNAPRFAVAIVEEQPIHDGGSGELIVRTTNLGDRPAPGGVLVLTVPSDVDLVSWAGPSWSCVDATISGSDGVLTCATTAVVAPGGVGPSLFLGVGVNGRPSSVQLSAWASAVGQFDPAGTPPTTATFTVASTVAVDAGPELTVATPVLGANGVVAPAVVTLTGTADLTSAKNLQWIQLCVQPNSPDCGETVSPAVMWLGVAAGALPTTATARFTAPAGLASPTDLYFRLTGAVGSSVISDDVVVHLVPSTFAPPDAAPDGAPSDGTGVPRPGPPAPAPPPTASIAGAGTTLQVATRAPGQLVGGGTGVGPLRYSWAQTSGPGAAITGASASQPILSFTSPTLDPDQQSETITFELTVTDPTGATATATASIDVVWGDDGLQVVLAGGAANVVGTIDGPVSIASTVTSRGAPYTYAWSVTLLELPSGTTTDAPTLGFTAGDAAANGTATLTVTDSFGRVSTASIAVIVSALPPGDPVAFCTAVTALQSGRPATLAGAGVRVTIPTGSVSTASCAAGTVITFTAASAALPGGVTLGAASGRVTIAGVSFSSATVSVPSNWSLGSVALAPDGLLAPFVSTSSIGVPSGALTTASTPLVAPTGWTGSTTISFTASPGPAAVLTATSAGPAAGQSLQLTGTSVNGAVTANVTGNGLVGIGPVDLPISGTVTTESPSAAPVFAVWARSSAPSTLAAGVGLASAALAWTPSQSTGAVTLTIGTGPSALAIESTATVTAGGTTFAVSGAPTVWSTTIGAPTVVMAGTGSLDGGQLQLALTSAPAGPWPIAAQLSLDPFGVSVNVDCPVVVDDACGPTVTVAATASGPQLAAPVPVTGSLDPSTGLATLVGTTTTVTVAPLTTTGVTLTVTLGPAGPAGASATGSASVLGTTVPVSVTFGPTATVAQAALGSMAITSGWTIPTTVAIATTSAFEYTAPVAPNGASASVPVPAGVLTGVGVTQMPSSLTSAVLPDDLQSGLVSFAIGTAPVTAYTIAVPIPTPWFVTGQSGTDASVQVTSMTFSVNASTTGLNVAVSGTGVVTAAATGTSTTTVPLPFTGQLTPGQLNLTFASTSAPWISAFGAPGFVASKLSVAITITPSTTTATLTGAMALPSALATNIGTGSASASPTFTVDLTSPTVCVSIDLSPSGGVDIGGYGFLEASTAYVALASGSCEVANATVGAGISVLLDGTNLGPDPGNVVLSVAPDTFALSATTPLTDLTFYLGGIQLTDATIDVSTGPSGAVTISVGGSASIAGQTVTLPTTAIASSIVPGSSVPFPAVQFSTTLDSFDLDWLTMSSPSLTISSPAIVTTASTRSTVMMSGTLPVLGGIPVELTGPIVGGEVGSLLGLVTQTSFNLNTGSTPDTLSVPFVVSYTPASPATSSGPASAATLTIDSPPSIDMLPGSSAMLSIVEGPSATRVYGIAKVSLTPAASGDGATAQISITALTPYLTEGLAGATSALGTVAGSYSLADGTYDFTGTSLPGTLAGLSAPTDLTFQRTSAGVVTATQSSQLSPGIFDTDATVTVSGALGVLGTTTITPATSGTTLTGSLADVGLRGLSGDATFTVAPSSPSLQVLSNYNAFQSSVSFATDPGSCALWDGNPTLQGIVYGSNGTTYYTLAGTTSTDLSVPVSIITSTPNAQPIVLSNEVIPGSPPATSGLTIAKSFSTTAFSGFGQVSLDFATCAFSVGGTAIMQFSALGPAGQALDEALSGPTGLQVQLGSLFGPSGELPPNVAIARATYQAEQVSAMLAAQARQQEAVADTQNQTLQAAQEQLQQARATAQQTQQELDAAQSKLATAEASAYLESFAAVYSEDALQAEAAQQNAEAAFAAVGTSTTEVATATAANDSAQGRVATLGDSVTRAQTAAATAEANAAELQEQSQQAAHPKILQLTLDVTYCTTCQISISVSVDGQFNFSGPWWLDFGFTYQFGSSTTAEIDLGVSFEEQKQFSADIFGASANLDISVTGNAGFLIVGDVPVALTDLSFTAQLQGAVDVWASIWCCTWNAQLASVSGQASLEVVPQPTQYSVSLELQVGPFEWGPSYGPAQL